MWDIAAILVFAFTLWFLYWMIKEGEAVKKDYEHQTNTMLRNFETLNREEKVLVHLLSRVQGDNPWKIKIFKTVRGGTADDFKKLIRELHSEGSANPPLMADIVGQASWNMIKNIFLYSTV